MPDRSTLKVALTLLLVVLSTLSNACGTSRAEPPRVIFEDDFDGSTLDSTKWNTCHWWNDGGCTIASNDELQWYLPEQVTVQDGRLELKAVAEPFTNDDGDEFGYRSGMVTTGPPTYEEDAKFAFTYGTVEARVRVPEGAGLWSALWLLPASTESRPEIDMMEIVGQEPDEIIMHLHPADRDSPSPASRYELPDDETFAAGWHDVRLDWSEDRLRWSVDGTEVWTYEGDDVPSEPMYLVANLAVGGAYGGEVASDTEFPATYEIDFVRVTGAQ